MKNARLEDWIGKITILLIQPESYVHISNEIPVELVKEWGMKGIIVSANKPFMTVKEQLQKLNILSSLKYLDCASTIAGTNPQAENLFLINNPADLTSLGICIHKCVASTSEREFLVVDSLTTLLIYNKEKDLIAFAHQLGMTLKSIRITTFFLMVEMETTKEMLRFLSTITDKIAHLCVGKEGEVLVE